ncbi:sugar transferase [Arenicella xantha]|uniref:Lipopolysaccharide/colanic/teichoic acid biosynthesis glycosyltransferase n=1 Tax=Arenicella xantha TaxID=644221 RepID=A0A395JKU2_9GAMM|nr:sugar transferase [Arenicella xantha]RBP51416.1 lipopolysaccharide/colanic/teichoic acid biosynthesis glycosyltransferase [Arenicella xantha]
MTHYRNQITFVQQLKRLIWQCRLAMFPISKRVLDVSVSLLAIILLSPLLMVVSLAIKLESPGALFFRQRRVGLDGMPFMMWKFRSMHSDAEARKAELAADNEVDQGVLFKIKKDPRVTKVGAVIRKMSIDELPQLINVLIGDMSLVGPRPPLPSEVAQYRRVDRARLTVRPGITCLWQVSGRSDIPFEMQVTLDVEYIERQSIGFDLLLLLKTIPAVLLARGAY